MNLNIRGIVLPAAIALCFAVILFVIRSITFRLLQRWGRKTETLMDDLILEVFRVPSVYWCIAIGLYIGVAVSDIPERYVFQISKTIHIIVIFSITIATANLAEKLFRSYIQRSSLPIPSSGLVYGILKGSIIVVGLLIILSVLGLSIAPLITALGVGGLAVALALQDTLANLFAGIHILIERSIRVGDFIRLESGQEGHVADITWRTTRIKMPSNNMVVIPNSKLSQSVVTNYSLPDKRSTLQIQIGVARSSDPDLIERILSEETKKAAEEVMIILSEPAPLVTFTPGIGESSLEFTLVCHIREFGDQNPAQHELRKRIFKRFMNEGISIPFPHRTVDLHEKADRS